MDELDRMHHRLVQNIRTSFPDHVSRPFQIAELYQTLIPYRHNRRELQLETNQDYELTLLRLLSGERGYLSGDPAMAAAMQKELSSPNPDLSAFRAWATTEVRLAEGGTPAGDAATRAETVLAPPALDARPTAPIDAVAPSASPSSRASVASIPRPASISPPLTLASTPPPIADAASRPLASIAAHGGNCRYCGGTLPDGRRITFCPHCGQNLTLRQCPACGTELEAGWRFCTTCGRDVGPPDL